MCACSVRSVWAVCTEFPNTSGYEQGTAFCDKADVLWKIGNLEDAMAMYRKALKIYAAVLGEDHLDASKTYTNAAAEICLFRACLE